jgi:hypothetical protein
VLVGVSVNVWNAKRHFLERGHQGVEMTYCDYVISLSKSKFKPYSRRSAGVLLLVGVVAGATVGGFAVVRATSGSSSASSFVPVSPVRVLDTRSDLGLVEVTDGVAGTLKVTGSIPTATSNGVVNAVVVPAGATAVVLNVTAVNPTAGGYVSLRPGDATGVPTVSTLNVTAGGTFPNGATITIPTTGAHAGQIQVWYEAEGTTVGSTELLIDIAGYYELASSGPAGPQGETGVAGPAGSSFTARSVCGSDGTTLCAVGAQGPGGGTVFFVDTEGRYSDFDYLEVAPADASSGVPWSTTTAHCGLLADTSCQSAFLTTSAEALNYLAIGTGRAATAAIIARHNAGGVAKTDYAAGIADAYATPTATDWFLPSRDELTELYRYVFIRPPAVLREGFTAYHHWSSSDFGPNSAWVRPFQSYFVDFDHSKSYPYYVRPVRAF